MDGTDQIGVESPLPDIVPHRIVNPQQGLPLVNRGIVDHDMQTVHVGGYAADHGLDRRRVGQVGLDNAVRPAAQRGQGFLGRGAILIIVNGDPPALPGELLGDGAPDTPGCAGDQGDFICQAHAGASVCVCGLARRLP